VLPILFALASLWCASINDVAFKLYARTGRPIGVYLAALGVVWTAVFTLLASPHAILFAGDATLFWGLFSGVFSVLANILLVLALARHEVGICSAIYRLNLAPAVLLAFLFLGERATQWKLLGIAAAIASILLLLQRPRPAPGSRNNSGLWLVVLASLLRAGMGISYKCGLSAGGDGLAMLALSGLAWIVGGAVYGLIAERRAVGVARQTFAYAAASSPLVCGIILFLMLALKHGDASCVLPIAQLSFLGSALLGVFFLREALTRRKVAGLSLALVCILLMAADR
jgi:uncharacterized membrane protein